MEPFTADPVGKIKCHQRKCERDKSQMRCRYAEYDKKELYQENEERLPFLELRRVKTLITGQLYFLGITIISARVFIKDGS